MAKTISEVMTSPAHTVAPDTTLREVAQIMRDGDVGDVVVTDQGHLKGIITDRDIVVRCVAEGGDCDEMDAGSVCSAQVVTVPPQGRVSEAVRVMRDDAIRRLPVVENDEVVGVVSMGDLAVEMDRESALADVSAADPNR